MNDSRDVLDDLTAAGDEIDRLVAELDERQWDTPTPAPGWTIKHQIAHLAFIFRLAGAAAGAPEAFKAAAAAAAEDFDGAVNAALAGYLDKPAATVLDIWREERAKAGAALAAVPAGALVPWLVNPLPAPVLACAGIMELFGHGQDVADALGIRREPTDGIRHLVGFATLTRDFGYQARGLTPPSEPFRFELTGPSGALWEFGPADAEQRITGSAHDFCLLATRRRHRADLELSATGAEADRYLDIAQAYRGPAGPGRTPGQFAHLG
ncbi:wyosine base formation [Streptomyces inusitatus]|uniref:Wyosine base formation n=1 Tax=Streptomyces inusitatus TaxID=68221 RepID=A0A918UZS6_9ACTN|nr:TIGR03084 family metal-binding protein [Streptomyces inusitatus]GGZ48880.1 wyosine base formation [Streptomyces inusitatus]